MLPTISQSVWFLFLVGCHQERLLKGKPEIVIGTPGRFWELMSAGEKHLVEIIGERPRRTDKARGKAPVGDSSHGRRGGIEEPIPQEESPWLHPNGTFFPDLLDPRSMTRKELEKIVGYRNRATSPSWGLWISICYNGLLMMRMEPTRIMDPSILKKMGVYSQLVGFLDRFGLGMLCTRHYSFYPEVVR